jgi:hypothetical protein
VTTIVTNNNNSSSNGKTHRVVHNANKSTGSKPELLVRYRMHGYNTRDQERRVACHLENNTLDTKGFMERYAAFDLGRLRQDAMVETQTATELSQVFEHLVRSEMIPWDTVMSLYGQQTDCMQGIHDAICTVKHCHAQQLALLNDFEYVAAQLSNGMFTHARKVAGYFHNRGICEMMVLLGVSQLAIFQEPSKWNTLASRGEILHSILRHLRRMTDTRVLYSYQPGVYELEMNVCKQHACDLTDRHQYGWYMTDIVPYILQMSADDHGDTPLYRLCSSLTDALNSPSIKTNADLLRAVRKVRLGRS